MRRLNQDSTQTSPTHPPRLPLAGPHLAAKTLVTTFAPGCPLATRQPVLQRGHSRCATVPPPHDPRLPISAPEPALAAVQAPPVPHPPPPMPARQLPTPHVVLQLAAPVTRSLSNWAIGKGRAGCAVHILGRIRGLDLTHLSLPWFAELPVPRPSCRWTR